MFEILFEDIIPIIVMCVWLLGYVWIIIIASKFSGCGVGLICIFPMINIIYGFWHIRTDGEQNTRYPLLLQATLFAFAILWSLLKED